MTTLTPDDFTAQLRSRMSLPPHEAQLIQTYAERLSIAETWWRDASDATVRLALMMELGFARDNNNIQDKTHYHERMKEKDRQTFATAVTKEAAWVTVRGKKIWVK